MKQLKKYFLSFLGRFIQFHDFSQKVLLFFFTFNIKMIRNISFLGDKK